MFENELTAKIVRWLRKNKNEDLCDFIQSGRSVEDYVIEQLLPSDNHLCTELAFAGLDLVNWDEVQECFE